MKKRTIQFLPIAAIVATGTLFSCVDSGKDLYDSSYETSNPMGDGFAAPDGIDWNMITTKNVTVEVKDEEGGLYSYLIDIYTENPLTNEKASPIATRTANKENNFKAKASISVLPTQKGIYVKQTDPRGREQVYPFNFAEDSNNLTCKLFYTDNTSRAMMSRAATKADITIEEPKYEIPADAQEIAKGMTLSSNTSYKITSNYAGTFKFDGNKDNTITRVYVNAEWTIPEDYTFQNGIEIIVMNDGRIVSPATPKFVNNSKLIIASGAIVTTGNMTFTDSAPAVLRNWGELTVANHLSLQAGATLYNGGNITAKNIDINSDSEVVNVGKIHTEDKLNLPSNFKMDNTGEITGKEMEANSKSTINNSGEIVFETIKLGETVINNSCRLEATTSFYSSEVTINFDKGFLKAPVMTLVHGDFNLNNGSMIEATESLTMPPGSAKIIGKGENPSLVKSPVITGQTFTYDGNLAVECNSHIEKNPNWNNFYVINGAYITKIGESKVVIETCDGTINGGNGGDTPSEPEYPIVTEDSRNYSYLFEDQWPLYGDYDMNDLVIIIKGSKIAINKANKVTEFTLNLELAAAGATKSIGAAIMLDGVPASAITQPVEFSDNSLFSNFTLNNNQIENGQDYAVVPLFDNAHKALGRDRYEQINTIKNQASNTNLKNISFTIKFNNPTIAADEFNIDKLNVFIIADGNRNNRKEIHLVGYKPTRLANTDLFGGNNDNSSISGNKYYISKDNLAWGIMVPADFHWPAEYINIKAAYSQFEGWVTSGGTKNETWWETFDSSKIYN